MIYKIGVVGFSGQEFDKFKAFELLKTTFTEALEVPQDKNIEIVSGLTDLGIPALAYRMAKDKGLKTAGVACSKAEKYDCYPCDRVEIVGDNWGDESETFLSQLDAIIRVGGGNQSFAEVAEAKQLGIPVYERDLEAIAQ